MSITLEQLVGLIIRQAREKGFGTKPEEVNTPEKFALIHAEVTEAFEAYRNKKFEGPDSFKEELSDVIARTLHLAAVHDIDIEEAILNKLGSNKERIWDWQQMNEIHAAPVERGKLLVIEGIDGSGKSTQHQLLREHFEKEGREVKSMHFPQHDHPFFGVMVDDYLNGRFGDATKVDPFLASMLYAFDRWEAAPQIIRWLEKGFMVVLDRYTSSNKGHQLSKLPHEPEGVSFLEWLDALEYEVLKVPRPDKVLYLDVPFATVIKQMRNRSVDDKGYIKGKFDHHESNTEHLKAAQEAYRFVTSRYDYWEKIDCVGNGQLLPKEVIHEKIWQAVHALEQLTIEKS